MSKPSDAALAGLIESNINALQDGLELIESLDAEHFTKSCSPAFQSNIGVHFRHVLEHYTCFLEQMRTGLVSYDERCRDMRLEVDSHYAKKTLSDICARLGSLEISADEPKIQVQDQPLTHAIESNLARELLFLLAHTVHHYAMIAAMARILGVNLKQGFGVAIATQVYLANTVTA